MAIKTFKHKGLKKLFNTGIKAGIQAAHAERIALILDLLRCLGCSVHPQALKRNIDILAENKRVITRLESDQFGTILYIEVGATNVGSIIQTCDPNKPVARGDEKRLFLLWGFLSHSPFPSNRIQLDEDLLKNTQNHLKTLGHFGESMGRAQSS